MRSQPADYDLRATAARPPGAAGGAFAHPWLAGDRAAAEAVRDAVDELLEVDAARHRRLWLYYANPQRPLRPGSTTGAQGSLRPYRQAQEWGVPPRITGFVDADDALAGGHTPHQRKEVVIENDIAWRVDTMVDFLFGQPITLESAAPDATRAMTIGDLLRGVLAANGGLAFLQKMALVGAVHGGCELLVKLLPEPAGPGDACDVAPLGGTGDDAAAAAVTDALARRIRLEIVEPARSLPILHPEDGERLCVHLQAFRLSRAGDGNAHAPAHGWFRKLLAPAGAAGHDEDVVVQAIGPVGWQTYRGGRLVASGPNPLGRIPLVHVQNVVRPFAWHGAGDVEPLIPLQDELNTRLSDRAYRVALHSMPMYLAVGLAGMADQKLAPGGIVETDNPDGRLVQFGGEAPANPAEVNAIAEVREALDKASGVNPVASGAIRGRVGNLTSAAALRLTFQSLLARTARKRANYGAAIAGACELALAWLDAAGLFKTTPDERRVRITWPDPIPADEQDRLTQAAAKQRLGVPDETVLRELGYRAEAD